MRSRAGTLVLALATALALLAAGCDGGGDDAGGGEDGGDALDTTTLVPGPADETTTSTAVATTSTSTVEPFGEASSEPRASDDYPAGDGALLVDLRVEAHPGLDRVVFELDGTAPGWSVRFVDPPVTERPSGQRVEVEGSAFLEVSMSRASTVDLSGEEPEVTFEPERVDAAGADAVTELVKVEDFEGVLAWTVGLDAERPFAVAVLDDPLRLVVDVPHA